MAKWIYNDKHYKTVPIDWDNWNTFVMPLHSVSREFNRHKEYMVYNTKWDKCFWLLTAGYHGNGNRLKVNIEDIYTFRTYWAEAKDFEAVVEDYDYYRTKRQFECL